MTPLQELLEKVEAGEFPADVLPSHLGIDPDACGHLPVMSTMYHTFSGSLDAAKALHEALLPGWYWEVSATGFACAHGPDGESAFFGWLEDNPARAWLIEILKALIAKGAE